MQNKVILVTGGSRGLGAKFVETLSAEENISLYYTCSSEPAASAAGDDAKHVTAIRCDQRNEAEIKDCIDKIIGVEGRIDVLVNNACPPFTPCDIISSDWSRYQELMDVNVKGSVQFTREAARVMKEQGGGKIINILSAYVMNVPPEKISFYVTAKYALLGFSRAAAAELGKFGITVNMISPGLMVTRLSEYLPEKYLQVYSQKHPMKRMTTTGDVAEVLKFLISKGSDFLNGVNIPVNGGEVF